MDLNGILSQIEKLRGEAEAAVKAAQPAVNVAEDVATALAELQHLTTTDHPDPVVVAVANFANAVARALSVVGTAQETSSAPSTEAQSSEGSVNG